MNCLNYRRLLLLDPNRHDDELDEHAKICPACAHFRERTLDLEQRIADAVMVPVPDELLADRILVAPATARKARAFLALAASLVLAIGIVIGVNIAPMKNDPSALAGIDFVVDEEVDAILHAKSADPGELHRVARSLRVSLPDSVGEMRYIGTCPYRGGIAHHVVLTLPSGKVTLLLFPGDQSEADARAASRGLTAVVKPVAGGTVTLVSRSETNIARTVEILYRS